MPQRRLHPRTAATGDLSATLRRAGRRVQIQAPVLNLSAGGLSIAGSGFAAGESVGVELAGPDFRFAGRGQVVHCTDSAVGVQIVSWDGSVHRAIDAVIAAGSAAPRDLAPVDPPTAAP